MNFKRSGYFIGIFPARVVWLQTILYVGENQGCIMLGLHLINFSY